MSISHMQPHEAAQVLGVLKAKNYRSVRKRWRQLATEHHPDKNPGREKVAEAEFKKFNDAFEVLERYQKNGGIWPIPRGFTPQPQQGWRTPSPTNPPPPEPSVRARNNNHRRRWRQHQPPPPPPPPFNQTRDRSWRKEKQPAQEPFSFNTGYGYSQSTLVHRDSFNQKLDRYLRQVFPNETAADQQMKAAYGQQFQVGDVKDILANHQYGNGPIKIEYTPTGRRVSWDYGPPAPTPQPSPTPQPQKHTSGPMYGGNPLNGRAEAPAPQPNWQPISTLSVHPLAYEQWYHASRGTGAAMLLPSVLTHPNGASNVGHFMVSYVGSVPHVNGVPCNLVLDSNAPVR